MQFGRIDGNAYILDFQYPFSAVQAFAVALANVTQRLKWKYTSLTLTDELKKKKGYLFLSMLHSVYVGVQLENASMF